MKKYQLIALLGLIFSSVAFSGPLSKEGVIDKNEPLPGQRLTLKTTDGHDVEACFLKGNDEVLYLIYSVPGCKLYVYNLKKGTPPDPQPPVPPNPTPTELRIAVIHDPANSTVDQRRVMMENSWRRHAAEKHELVGILPYNLIDPDTNKVPEKYAPFIEAAKTLPLPALVMLDQDGKVIVSESLPRSSAEILKIMSTYEKEKPGHAKQKGKKTFSERTSLMSYGALAS